MVEKYLTRLEEVNEKGFYKPNWASLSDREVPKWFKEAKFGIFVHWGLYSIPAFNNEWYSRNMYKKDSEEYKHHIETYGAHKDFGYKDFIPMFTAEKFNADEWISAFKGAGAKYLFQVAEHHEGFQMYKSEISKWNVYDMGPKRDVLGELKESCEKHGIELCASSHRAEHWFFMSGGTEFESDIIKENEKCGDFYWPAEPERDNYDFFSDPYPSQEFCEDWLIRTIELIDNYQPSVLYFDWWVQHDAFKPYVLKLAAYYYNRGLEWGKDVAICYKHDVFAFGSGIVEIERGKFKDAKPFYWQTDTAIAKNSWCYTDTLDYKTTYDIVTNLIDIVSKNGNLLLNVGPKGSGEIPEPEKKMLKEIGEWLSVNGEGIYKSRPWVVSSEGPAEEVEGKFSEGDGTVYTNQDIRFTVANGCYYAFVLNYDTQETVIKSMKKGEMGDKAGIFSEIESVDILGFDEEVRYELTTDGLKVKTENVKTNLPVTFRVKLK